MTEQNDFQWLNSAKILISSQSSQWLHFTLIKDFILEWISIQIWLIMKQFMNVLKLEKLMISSFKWKNFLSLIINNWKKWSRSLKFKKTKSAKKQRKTRVQMQEFEREHLYVQTINVIDQREDIKQRLWSDYM